MRQTLLSLAVFSSALLASGCGSGMKILKASKPSALAALGPKSSIAVAFDYSQLKVEKKPLEAWIASKTTEHSAYSETWATLMDQFETTALHGLRSRYTNAHMAAQGPGDVTITIRPQILKLGKYIVIAAGTTFMNMIVSVRVGDSEVIDEVQFVQSHQSSAIEPSVFTHIKYIGNDTGEQLARFLWLRAK